MTTTVAMVNGRVLPASEAMVPITDPAVTLGWSVFETLAVEGGVPLNPDAHLARLEVSARAALIPLPARPTLHAELHALAAAGPPLARLRVTLTGGGWRLMTSEPLDPSRRHGPVRAVRRQHRPEPFLGGGVKHGSRAPWVVALRESGVDEVLLVEDGRFKEGTTSAILAVIDGVLWLHPEDGSVLASTTAQLIRERAVRLSVPTRDEAPPARGPWDGLYIASSTRDLAPVVELDGECLNGWDPIGRLLAGL